MGKIFISYRRHGVGDIALLLAKELKSAFGERRVVMDISHIKAGTDFWKSLADALNDTELVVVVVGHGWLNTVREHERSGQTDYMRSEITQALAMSHVKVVPVYVHDASVLLEKDLPDDLKQLAKNESLHIHEGKNKESDLKMVVNELGRSLETDGTPFPAPSPHNQEDPSRRRGRSALFAAILVWLALMAWRELLPPRPIDKLALHHLLYDNCWVTYDPSGKTLDSSRLPIYPPLSAMATDLQRIKSAGFSGILTTSSHLAMADVPRMAKSLGLHVIMGVWDPADRAELERAIRQAPYVDAYCIGDAQAQHGMPVEILEQAMWLVKKRTGRPAAVSDLVKKYDDRLARLGDWLFPDAHLTLADNPDISRDVELLMQSTKTMAKLAQGLDCPLIFKNVAYPHRGLKNFSDELQRDYFRQLLIKLNDAQDGHIARTSIVAQEAFDAPWKAGGAFLPWDPFTGLMELDPVTGHVRAKPAVEEILRWYPHLKLRLPPE